MKADNILSPLEKIALITTGAAAAFKVLLWSLGLNLNSTDMWLPTLRIVFALLSFVAFDLVLVAVVIDQRQHGRTLWGLGAAAGAAAVSALIALDVAAVWAQPWLHAAPAVTLLLFTLHLVEPRPLLPQPVAEPPPPVAEPPQAVLYDVAPPSQITQAVQVNVAVPAPLPRTVAEYIAARAGELPQLSHPALAAELGTSADTVRRALSATIKIADGAAVEV